MKYMGSKRTMLGRGLADAIERSIEGKSRFVDLFSGTATISHYVASKYPVSVLSVDLQEYSKVLALSVLSRVESVDFHGEFDTWFTASRKILKVHDGVLNNMREITQGQDLASVVEINREHSAACTGLPITRSYGGHYFSFEQTLTLDAFRSSLDDSDRFYFLKLASLISAASRCASSPGHTAQPFQPTTGSGKYLRSAWNRDPIEIIQKELRELAGTTSLEVGASLVADANTIAKTLSPDDLVFIDPPYSEVQYSRFYHVLETIANGDCGPVSGIGRYPSLKERPQSSYSKRRESGKAVTSLIDTLAENNVSGIITYPNGQTSNGLSGAEILRHCESRFAVRSQVVNGQFSTLGGSRLGRGGRIPSYELIIEFRPKFKR